MPKYNTADTCHVSVFDNDVEGAVRKLKKRFAAAGIVDQLRLRKEHPSRSDRRRAKARRALKRTRRAQARRGRK